jgi:hypothetical protein
MPPVSANARWTTSRDRDARRPRRIVALKSGRRRSRDAAGSTGIAIPGGVRPTGPDGPFGGEQRGSPDPHECACAAGSHGSLRGGDYSAGTCACSLEGSRKETVQRVVGGRRGSSGSMGQKGGRMPQGCQGFCDESEDSLWEPAGHKDLLRYGPSTNTVKPACVPPGTALDACWSADGLRLVRELTAGNPPGHAILRLSCSVVENALMHRAARC